MYCAENGVSEVNGTRFGDEEKAAPAMEVPRRATATAVPPNLFGGDATRQSADEEFQGNVPDESKDDLAIRLRTAGLTFREIGAQMGVDPSMAHRRVKRAMIRRRCEMQDRMEDVRDLEFEKLRIAERALMPQVAEGDHNAIRLLVRIIELRKRYLKDLPYEKIKDDPHFELMDDDRIPGCEDDDPFEEEPADEEQTAFEDQFDAAPQSEAERAVAKQAAKVEATEAYLAYELTPGSAQYLVIKEKLEVEQKKLLSLEAALEKEGSTTRSTSDQDTTQSRQNAKDRKEKVGDAVRHETVSDQDISRVDVQRYLRAIEETLEKKASNGASTRRSKNQSTSEYKSTQSHKGAKDRKGKRKARDAAR
ncbi:MAG: hypothetical protein MI757_01330 [Pirellulales bacterium]|nr:hypothetical protein [Pirellulales bacterium]